MILKDFSSAYNRHRRLNHIHIFGHRLPSEKGSGSRYRSYHPSPVFLSLSLSLFICLFDSSIEAILSIHIASCSTDSQRSYKK